MYPKIGLGCDIHKFSEDVAPEGNAIKICGLDVPYDHFLVAHSDGDVGLHSLVDAILGAVAMGDIGEFFPPSDPQWKDVDSEIFVKKAQEVMGEKGYKIGNVDVTIICERPKISPYKLKMRERIAEILSIDVGCVSVKAKTNEKLDSIGERRAIAAHCAVMAVPK